MTIRAMLRRRCLSVLAKTRIDCASRLSIVAFFLAAILLGCDRSGSNQTNSSPRVVLYTSVDQPVAEPLIRAFEQRTGYAVDLRTDTEATKSAGLAARLLAEKANPQADVYWGNEVFHTINLARNGVLAPYASPEADSIPNTYRDLRNYWAGTCLRARVIAAAPQPSGAPFPRWLVNIDALTDPALKDRFALARPTAGTTGGHVSALYAAWGTGRADGFFRALHANGAKMLGGNSVVAEHVGQGEMLAGLTDNDDVAAVNRAGAKLNMHVPDQGEGELGTLTIPCTVALVANRPDSDAARRLVDYLLSAEVEQALIAGGFGQFSVRAPPANAIRALNVTYDAIADRMSWAPSRAAAILEGQVPGPAPQ